MTRLFQFALGLALVAIWAGSAAQGADKKIDITGNWAFEVELGGMQGAPEFMLKQDGEKLTGKYKGQFGEADVTGMIKGEEFEFSFEIQDGAKAVYTGTVEKDGTLKGKADYAGQASGTWTGKRKKDDK
jgi:hypothetical protein